MERPSHTHFITSNHPNVRRVPLVALAAFVQFVIVWGFLHGFGGQISHITNAFKFVPETKTTLPRTPPPPVPAKPVVKLLTAVPVELPQIAQDPNAHPITLPRGTETGSTGTVPQPPVLPSRAPAGITATHTLPPYPAAERRMGMEGTVMLRLTVLADGHVGQAEVVKSSGHAALDDAAKAWIIANWLYKPALDKGVAATGQTLASVTFNLKADR